MGSQVRRVLPGEAIRQSRHQRANHTALNQWIKSYCERNGDVYLDYYSATIDDHQMFKRELTYDGLHPNAQGYQVMGPLAEKAIAQALAAK